MATPSDKQSPVHATILVADGDAYSVNTCRRGETVLHREAPQVAVDGGKTPTLD